MRWRRQHVITKEVMDRTPHRGYEGVGDEVPWPGAWHVTRWGTQAKREAPKQQKASETQTSTQPKADGS